MHDVEHIMEIDSIRKSYGDVKVLSDIYLKLKSGDICALFGRNGAGKSTLLKVIFGILRADNKFIRVDDRFMPTPYLQPSIISYLPADSFLPKNLKVKKVLSMYSVSSALADSLILEISNQRVNELSMGERRYLEIFILLFKSSHFLLLDEPFTFLSPLLVEKLSELILSQSKEKGIIITDHRYESVLSVANRILMLKDGCLQELSDKESLMDYGYVIKH